MKLATAAFVSTFVALIGYSVVGASTIRQAAEQTLSADSLNHQYEYVERELWREASLVRSKDIDPAHSDFYANLRAERLAADAIESSLNVLRATGSRVDRSVAERFSLEYARYTDVLRTLFAEIDTSSADTARTYESSVLLFDTMQRQIDVGALHQQRSAVSALRRLETIQANVVRSITVGAIVGSLLLSASGVMIVRDRRAIESARRTEYARLATASLTDTLTGLGNHRAYDEEFGRVIARAARRNERVSLALIDVDDFKLVNDSKGHIHGDEVLACIGRLIACNRKGDLGYRLGGDEFAIVLAEDSTNDSIAMERLRRDVAVTLNGVTVSIGTSSMVGARADARGLRAEADAALYAAKHRGRNRIVAFERLPSQETHEAADIVADAFPPSGSAEERPSHVESLALARGFAS